MKLKNLGRTFWLDEDGATAIEYGLIAALVAIGIITSLQGFASSSNSMWNVVTNQITESL